MFVKVCVILTIIIFIYTQVYTIDVAGSKRVVISGYDNFHNLLVKSADYTSTRSTASMTKVIQDAARDTPGTYV